MTHQQILGKAYFAACETVIKSGIFTAKAIIDLSSLLIAYGEATNDHAEVLGDFANDLPEDVYDTLARILDKVEWT